MDTMDIQQFLLYVLEQAEAGKSIEFRLINSWLDFRYCRKMYKATSLIIKTLKKAVANLFKDYCKDVIAGVSDSNKILAYAQLLNVIEFYERDLETLKKMLDEYDNFLGDWGNFFHAIFGGEREI